VVFFSDISGGVEGAKEVGETVGILNENLQGNLTGIQDILSGKIFEDFKFPTFDFSDFKLPDIFGFDVTEPTGDPVDITETPAGQGRASNRGRTIPDLILDMNNLPRENQNVQSQLRTGQQFFGGGPSFIGGAINETPIENLSLGQIIDRFGVTASKARDIQARARNDFGDFNFGTNTGSGIGSVFANSEINSVIANLGGNVSNPNFGGLSAQEIALRLTGGNVSNF